MMGLEKLLASAPLIVAGTAFLAAGLYLLEQTVTNTNNQTAQEAITTIGGVLLVTTAVFSYAIARLRYVNTPPSNLKEVHDDGCVYFVKK